MGNSYNIPEAVKQMPVDKNTSFKGSNINILFQVHIVYCGGWGYEPMFRYAKEMIKTVFPNAEVTGEPTPSRTGWFEVTLTKKDGSTELIYSKKNGDGALEEKNAKPFMDKLVTKVKPWQINHLKESAF